MTANHIILYIFKKSQSINWYQAQNPGGKSGQNFCVGQDRQWWHGEGECCHDLTTAQHQIQSQDLGRRVLHVVNFCELMVVIGGGVTADQASNSILSEARLYSKLYITQYGNFKSFMTLPENLQQWGGAAKATAVWVATRAANDPSVLKNHNHVYFPWVSA